MGFVKTYSSDTAEGLQNTIDDFYGIGDKINSKIISSPVFDTDNIIDSSIMSKLSSSCNINISVPDITVPDISIDLAA